MEKERLVGLVESFEIFNHRIQTTCDFIEGEKIIVKSAGRETLAEEMSEAYKDISNVFTLFFSSSPNGICFSSSTTFTYL